MPGRSSRPGTWARRWSLLLRQRPRLQQLVVSKLEACSLRPPIQIGTGSRSECGGRSPRDLVLGSLRHRHTGGCLVPSRRLQDCSRPLPLVDGHCLLLVDSLRLLLVDSLRLPLVDSRRLPLVDSRRLPLVDSRRLLLVDSRRLLLVDSRRLHNRHLRLNIIVSIIYLNYLSIVL